MQILTSILCCLDDPSHVAAAAVTCKRLRDISASAPLHLRIAPSKFMIEDEDGVETLCQDRLRSFLNGLCGHFKGEGHCTRHLPKASVHLGMCKPMALLGPQVAGQGSDGRAEHQPRVLSVSLCRDQ